MDTLFASFSDVNQAQQAGGALLDHGFEKDHLSLIANVPHEGVVAVAGDTALDPMQSAKNGVSVTTGADAAAGAAKGAGVGLLVGGVAALASLFIPGFGLVVGGGALATALMAGAGTAAAGALAGGAAGFLVDQGVPHEAAENLERAIKDGGAIIAVTLGPYERLVLARDILAKYGASNVTLHSAGAPAGQIIV